MKIGEDANLEDYLRDHGVDTKRAAGSEITAACFFTCQENRANKRKLYLNAETWLWDCKVCGEKGGRRRLLEHFGDEDENGYEERASNPATRSRVLDEYAALTESMLLGNDAMLSYLFDRGLSPQTIEAARLGYVPRGQLVSEMLPSALVPGGFRRMDLESSGMVSVRGEFHSGKITIPYLSGRHVLQIRGKDPKGKYFTPAGDQVRLYNADALRDADVAVVCEGEFDALILQQHFAASPDAKLRNIAVVAIPGAAALPGGKDVFAENFRHCKRVYVLLDSDDTGRREAVNIKMAIGSIARIVELPNEDLVDSAGDLVKLDVTEWLRPKTPMHPYGGHTWRDVADLFMAADMLGKRIFSVGEATVQWREDAATGSAIPLGFPSLDAMMGGGLRVGDLMIPVAKTGTGKSVLLANICFNVQQAGIPALLISLETTASQVYDILRRVARFHGDPRMSEGQIADSMPTLRIVQENRLSPEDFAMLVEEYRADLGFKPRIVLVDYLGYYARGRKGNNQYEKVSDATMQLKAEAKEHRVAMIAPHQVNRGAKDGHPLSAEEARDSGVVEETADWMLGLYRPGEATETAGAVTSSLNMNVLKGRRGGKGRQVNLAMSNLSLAIIDKHDKRDLARIEMENNEYNRGTKYDDWLRDQRSVEDGRQQMRLIQ